MDWSSSFKVRVRHENLQRNVLSEKHAFLIAVYGLLLAYLILIG